MISRITHFMSVKEASRIIGVTPQAIRKAIKENRLDAYIVGEQYVISFDNVANFKFDRERKYKRKVE